LDRQGPDRGSQYRSVIFYHDEGQEKLARASKERVSRSGKFHKPIVTLVEPAKRFWIAEEYHQRYFEKHGGGSCHVR
jgi:peptide-methionine (S)-S-oxide reductase